MKEANAAPSRSALMDILKGCCILWVLLDHMPFRGEEELQMLYPFWVYMAIPCMMIISGYLYTKSYQRAGIQSFAQAYEKHFLCRHILRFVVPYSLVFAVEWIAGFGEFKTGGGTLKELVWLYIRGGNGPGAYYFSLMLQFLLVFPFVYFLTRSHKFSVPFFLLVSFLFDLFNTAFFMESTEGYTYWIFRHLFAIAFGCALALNKTNYKTGWYFLSWALGLCYLFLIYYRGVDPWFIRSWKGTSYLSILYVAPVFSLVYAKCQNLRCPPLEALGRISFDIYLAQKFFFEWDICVGISRRTYRVLASFVICLLLGFVLRMIEAPICRFCQKQADKLLDALEKPDWEAIFMKKKTEAAQE